jgi:hypothetical protein
MKISRRDCRKQKAVDSVKMKRRLSKGVISEGGSVMAINGGCRNENIRGGSNGGNGVAKETKLAAGSALSAISAAKRFSILFIESSSKKMLGAMAA